MKVLVACEFSEKVKYDQGRVLRWCEPLNNSSNEFGQSKRKDNKRRKV